MKFATLSSNLSVFISCYVLFNRVGVSPRDMLAMQAAGRSQAQMKYTTLDIDVMTDLVWKKFCNICQELSVADNFYLCLFMSGRRSMLEPIPDSSLPPYLTKDGFHQLKVILCDCRVIASDMCSIITICCACDDRKVNSREFGSSINNGQYLTCDSPNAIKCDIVYKHSVEST